MEQLFALLYDQGSETRREVVEIISDPQIRDVLNQCKDSIEDLYRAEF